MHDGLDGVCSKTIKTMFNQQEDAIKYISDKLGVTITIKDEMG